MRQNDLFLGARSDGTMPVRTGNATLGQFFTPFWAAEILAEDVLRNVGRVSVVEPSCGTGAFLAALPEDVPAYGVEIDPEIAAMAVRNTSRRVLIGDFRTIELPEDEVSLVIGNPPFDMETIDGFLQRSHSLLPDEGVCAFILPAHTLSTAPRVERWASKFAIESSLIPRSLFDRLSLPLVWAKFTKTDRRTLVGMMLFAETADVQRMPREIRRRLAAPGTWRAVIQEAIDVLGGEATLAEIYAAVEPRRPSQQRFWRDKVRQNLHLYGERLPGDRWRMP